MRDSYSGEGQYADQARERHTRGIDKGVLSPRIPMVSQKKLSSATSLKVKQQNRQTPLPRTIEH